MNILQLSQTLNPRSGWGRVANGVIHAARQDGHTIIAGSCNSEESEGKLDKWVFLRSQKKWTLKPFMAAMDSLSLVLRFKNKIDLVLCTDEAGVILGAFVSQLLGVPLVIMVHGTYALRCQKSIYPRFHRWAYGRATRIFISSRYTKKCFDELVPSLRKNTHVLRLGRDESFSKKINLGYSERKYQIVTVGAVKERKGLLLLVKSLLQIPQLQRPKLIVVGALDESPEYVNEVRRFISANYLGENVIFKGKIPDDELYAIYKQSMLFVLPSQNTAAGDFEGFGLVHLEAQSYGVPAIGSHECGNEDVILHSQTGFLLPQGNTESLAACIQEVMSDESIWESFSSSAYKFAAQFTWEAAFSDIKRCVDLSQHRNLTK